MMIKALLATRSPGLCAAIYAAAMFTNSFMFAGALGGHWDRVFLALAITGAASYAFFWALVKTEDMGGIWWAVLVVGVALLAFVVP